MHRRGSSVAVQHKFVSLKTTPSTVHSYSPPVSILILEMSSDANKGIIQFYTCSICKRIAVPRVASDGNQKTLCCERQNSKSNIEYDCAECYLIEMLGKEAYCLYTECQAAW